MENNTTHICKYCNAETSQPDEQCYANPNNTTIMNTQTAVDWLAYKLNLLSLKYELPEDEIDELIKQAKEMEKEQIVKSMGIAFNDMLEIQEGKKSPYKDWEQYYNKTYGE
jgi:hypothetical protein